MYAPTFLMFIGVSPAVAVASSANQIVATSYSGFLAYLRKQHVDFKMGTVFKIEKGILGRGRTNNDHSSPATIPSIGTSLRNIFFPAETDAPVPAIPAFHKKFGLINE